MRLQIRYLFALICLFIVACTGQIEQIEQQVVTPLPTLTSLPVDWAQLTAVATKVSPTIQPTATSTPTVIPPTATAVPTALPTETATPTLTPEPTPTVVLATPTITPSPEEQLLVLLLADRPVPDEFISKSQLKEQIKVTQIHIRDLAFLLNQTAAGEALDCQKFVPAYRFLQVESPLFTVAETLEAANVYYNQAIERGVVSLNPIYEACALQATADEFQPLVISELNAEMFELAYEQRDVITKDINNALLWINADNSVMRGLYANTQTQLAQLDDHFKEGTTTSCDEIKLIYDQLRESPRVIVPNGQRLDAYLNYLDALDFIEQGSAAINLYCTERLSHNNGTPDEEGEGLPLPPDQLEVAQRTWRRALTAIITAYDLLAQPRTDLPDVSAEVLDITAGPGNNDYTIRIHYTANAGTPPYSALIGGFQPGPGNIFTIAHTCDQDFFNMVVVFDSLGDRYQSVKMSASGNAVCP